MPLGMDGMPHDNRQVLAVTKSAWKLLGASSGTVEKTRVM